MSYRLIYTKHAAKDIRGLSPELKQRLKSTLEKYSHDPLSYALKLTHPELGTFRFRMGDYRIIFDLVDDAIVVLRVGHRRDIYRSI